MLALIVIQGLLRPGQFRPHTLDLLIQKGETAPCFLRQAIHVLKVIVSRDRVDDLRDILAVGALKRDFYNARVLALFRD